MRRRGRDLGDVKMITAELLILQPALYSNAINGHATPPLLCRLPSPSPRRPSSPPSFEHDGLGRYGDPLNPAGDLEAMKLCHNRLKKDGVLYLSVPTGKDEVVWNEGRVYGRERFKMMLEGFELKGSFGRIEWDTRGDGTQPVFVLGKTAIENEL